MFGKSCTAKNRLIPKKYGIYESVVAFLIGSLCVSAEVVGKEQRNINEEMHFLRQIKGNKK